MKWLKNLFKKNNSISNIMCLPHNISILKCEECTGDIMSRLDNSLSGDFYRMSDFTKRVEILTNLFENNNKTPSVDAVAEAITEAYYLGVDSADSAIQRVRELAEAFVTAGYQGDWTGVEIRAAILDALDGEK